jgi:Holliday junction resolvase
VSAMSRRKGATHERSVIGWLRSLGRPHVERRIMGMATDSGDVCGWPGVIIECKNAQRLELAVWVDQLEAEIEQAEADTGVLIVKRRGVTDPGDFYAVMPARRWHELMVEAGR